MNDIPVIPGFLIVETEDQFKISLSCTLSIRSGICEILSQNK